MHEFTRRSLLQGGTALAAAGALTGPALLDQSSTLEGTLVQWLAAGGPPPEPPSQAQLNAGAGGDLETTGTRYGR